MNDPKASPASVASDECDAPATNAPLETRTLRFTLMIETELGGGDEPAPTVRYVADWLNDNGYGYAQIGEWEVVGHVQPDT